MFLCVLWDYVPVLEDFNKLSIISFDPHYMMLSTLQISFFFFSLPFKASLDTPRQYCWLLDWAISCE